MRGILDYLKNAEIASVNEIANSVGSNWKVIKNRIELSLITIPLSATYKNILPIPQ